LDFHFSNQSKTSEYFLSLLELKLVQSQIFQQVNTFSAKATPQIQIILEMNTKESSKSFRNLFPDLRTETQKAIDQRHYEASLIQGRKEVAEIEQNATLRASTDKPRRLS
jgi:hypothetical protein